MQVTVRDLMTSEPLTIRELATVEEATRMILDRAVTELYVVDENGCLLGTVSDFTLLKARIVNCDPDELVTQYISRHMQLLNPDMRLDEVAGYFRESCCAKLAVVEAGHVVGQLSRRDILRAMVVLEELALEAAEKRDSATATVHRFESPEDVIPPQPSGLAELPKPERSAATAIDRLKIRQPGLQ